MRVKVSEASGAVLDWLVATAEGSDYCQHDGVDGIGNAFEATRYSTNWSQGGPIVEREIGNLWKHNKIDPNEPDVWTAAVYHKAPDGTLLYYEEGPTPLIAAMRCYVASKLDDEVEVPDELL